MYKRQVEQKLSARDQVAKEAGERSGIQVMRYVRLTELIPELLDMVDEKKIAFNPAYELSFLKPDEQQMLVETMDYEQATPSLSQAQRMKKFSQDGKLSEDVMLAIMSEEKKGDLDKVTLSSDTLRKYFPKSYTPAKMQETIIDVYKRQDDHYFGVIKPRVAAYMADLNEELWKLGVLAKTEHNEVAPSQHELAPIYTTTTVSYTHLDVYKRQVRHKSPVYSKRNKC